MKGRTEKGENNVKRHLGQREICGVGKYQIQMRKGSRAKENITRGGKGRAVVTVRLSFAA